MRRWYASGGKFGNPIDEIEIYELAIDIFRCNPNDLRQWDLYDLSRVQLVLRARNEAAQEIRKNASTKS